MKNKGYKSFTKKINIYQTKELGHLLSFREGVSHLGGPRREYKLEMVHDSFRKKWMRWAKVLLKHIFSQYINAFKKSFTWRNDRCYKATIHMEQAHIWRKTWSERIHAPQCSLRHCWQQPRHGSNLNVHWGVDKEDVHMQNGTQRSHCKECNNAICGNVDRLRQCHTKWSRSASEEQRLWHPIHVASRRKWYKWIYLQNRKTHNLRKWSLDCWGEGTISNFGKVMYTLLYLKWITNKDLLYSTWNSAQGYVPTWMGEQGLGEEWVHVYVWLSPSAVHPNYHHIVNELYPKINKRLRFGGKKKYRWYQAARIGYFIKSYNMVKLIIIYDKVYRENDHLTNGATIFT